MPIVISAARPGGNGWDANSSSILRKLAVFITIARTGRRRHKNGMKIAPDGWCKHARIIGAFDAFPGFRPSPARRIG